MAGQKRRKAINFDLDTQTLRSLFGEAGRRKAYADIGRFLKKNGFDHRQGSGYQSSSTMTEAEITDLIVALYEALPWLEQVVQKLNVTNIGRDYDMHLIAKRQIDARKTAQRKRDFDVI